MIKDSYCNLSFSVLFCKWCFGTKALPYNGRRKRAYKSLIWSTRAYIAQAIVSPLYIRGQLLAPKMKGGLPMSTTEVLTLCLVIIGICDLFVQIIAMRKK